MKLGLAYTRRNGYEDVLGVAEHTTANTILAENPMQIALSRHAALEMKPLPGKGKGVVATAFIPKDTLVEIAPSIRLTRADLDHIDQTLLGDYVFVWDETDAISNVEYPFAIIAGIISMLNHSGNANMRLESDSATQTMSILADRDIVIGEELTIDYGDTWFEEHPHQQNVSEKNLPGIVPLLHTGLDLMQVSGKGRGIIAKDFIPAGSMLEVAPVVPLHKAETERMSKTLLDHYVFDWPAAGYDSCMPLGILVIVNHSPTPNADWDCDLPAKVTRLHATKDIQAGEEVTIDYGVSLWFEEN